ncbi:unnamed protein product [Urochloa decumbens]|uniref:BRI1 kinase inhibitor 1 n=1 Tax=Urochloa decumbens TaxID=240449 RepID=A0ABC9BGU8_9POAL
MDHHLGRVVSDLSHSNSRGARRHGLHHRSTTRRTNTDGGGGSTAKQKLALLFSGVVSWARKESGAASETGSSSSRPTAKSRRQQEAATNNNGGGGARRRGVDIVMAVRKYVSMVEQLFASYSGGGGGRNDGDARRRRPHTFTYARGGGGGASSSKRHKGRLSSAPASLRGSPANSGHLAVGESVMTTKKASTSSEVSTMEELHSAIQAAIAHCKSSAAAAAGDGRQ